MQKTKKTLQKLKEEYFPDLRSDQTPSLEDFRKKVLELHKAEQQEEAAGLLEWYEKTKNKTTKKRTKKILFIFVFTLGVITVTLGALWFTTGGANTKSTNTVVCTIDGENFSGRKCTQEAQKETQQELQENNNAKKNESDDEIFVGQ